MPNLSHIAMDLSHACGERPSEIEKNLTKGIAV